MRKKIVLTAAMIIAMSMPVLAKEFTTDDMVLNFENVDEGWEEVENPGTYMTLQKGDSLITVMHYSNGEKLPERTIAQDFGEGVYEASISTPNEVFLITGSVADMADFEEMRTAVEQVKILKYDTKKALKKPTVAVGGNSAGGQNAAGNSEKNTGSEVVIEECSFSNWVLADRVNVRSGYSTESDIIGRISYADAVEVTGRVLKGGSPSGWYRIRFEGGEGFVFGEYLTEEGPSAEKNGITLTKEQRTLWTTDGMALNVNRAVNGGWFDGSGREYVSENGSWICVTSGETFTEEEPHQEDIKDTAVQQVSVWDEDHYNMQTLYQAADGTWQNIAHGLYQDNGDGTWAGADGTCWYME